MKEFPEVLRKQIEKVIYTAYDNGIVSCGLVKSAPYSEKYQINCKTLLRINDEMNKAYNELLKIIFNRLNEEKSKPTGILKTLTCEFRESDTTFNGIRVYVCSHCGAGHAVKNFDLFKYCPTCGYRIKTIGKDPKQEKEE